MSNTIEISRIELHTTIPCRVEGCYGCLEARRAWPWANPEHTKVTDPILIFRCNECGEEGGRG